MPRSTDFIESNAVKVFAAKTKKLREERGLLQGQLAEILGVSRPSLSAYENGTTPPDILVLDRAARYFEVSSDYLLGRDRGKTAEKSQFINESGLSDEAADKLFALDAESQRGTKLSGEANAALRYVNDMEDDEVFYADKITSSEALSMLLESDGGAEFLQLVTRLLLVPAFSEKDFEPYNDLRPTTNGESLWQIYRKRICSLDSALDVFNSSGDICLELTAADLLYSAIEKMLRNAIEDIRHSEESKKNRMRAFLYQHHSVLRNIEIDGMLFGTIKSYKAFIVRYYPSDEVQKRLEEYYEIHSSTENFKKALAKYCDYPPEKIEEFAEEHRIGHSSLKAYRIMLGIRGYPPEEIEEHVEEHRKYFFSKNPPSAL